MTTRNWAIALHMGEVEVELPRMLPSGPGNVLVAGAVHGDVVDTEWTALSALAATALFPPATEPGQLLVSAGAGINSDWTASSEIDRGILP